MAAIRRSFSGALQRRRSASMTPEQKTEETKLERLTERFERGMRNLKTLEARLITVSGAARNFKTALADLACGQLEDANGWPRGPTDVDVALVNADEHGIVGRIASACCAPLRRLVAEGNELRLLCKRRRDLVADRDHRKQKLQQIEKACERAKDPEKIRGQVQEASQKYVAAVDAADRATGHCTILCGNQLRRFRDPPRHRPMSRRWRGNSTPSSRRSYRDSVASINGARNMIPYRHRRARRV